MPNKIDKSPSDRNKRKEAKERKKIVCELLLPKEHVTTEVPNPLITPSETPSSNIDANGLPSRSNQSPFDVLLQKYIQLQKENEDLKVQNTKSLCEIEALQEKMKLQGVGIADNNCVDARVKEILSEFFTPNQVDILLKKKSKARWTADEISKAFTLRYFSKRAYIYMRQTLKYPLPGISTLQSWASNVDLQHGVLKDILRVMETCGDKKTELQRLTVLTYDEVKVSSLIEYDQKCDEIVGPYKYMQVVMARGLFSQWKQPVFIGFDTKMTKLLLEQIVSDLNAVKYEVVACVSDCGGGNLGVWKELNINIDQTFFFHPITKNKIYVFADIPHILKLIRNWFLDHGFILQDGKKITKAPVKCLIEKTTTEISSCHKLKPIHITCEKSQRQNVALAAQLMSNTTATALKRYLPGEDKELAKNVGDFFQMINIWFDILNSYSPSASVQTKRPYGTNFENQNQILNTAIETFKSMRVISKNSLQIFQKGAIISTTSVQHLFQDLKERYGISYILTHRLNQDCLENLFSQVKKK